MPRCGPEHTDLEITVQGADYLDPSTPALPSIKSLASKSGEHAMWFAVLEVAVRDIMSSNHRKLVRKALKWIEQPSCEFGDFLWIAESLQIEGTRLQSRLSEIGQSRLRELATRKSAS